MRGGARQKRTGRGCTLEPHGLPPAAMSTTLLVSILQKISFKESIPVIFFLVPPLISNDFFFLSLKVII